MSTIVSATPSVDELYQQLEDKVRALRPNEDITHYSVRISSRRKNTAPRSEFPASRT